MKPPMRLRNKVNRYEPTHSDDEEDLSDEYASDLECESDTCDDELHESDIEFIDDGEVQCEESESDESESEFEDSSSDESECDIELDSDSDADCSDMEDEYEKDIKEFEKSISQNDDVYECE